MKLIRQIYALLAYVILSITSSVSYAADTQSLDEYLSQFLKGKTSSEIAGFSNIQKNSKEGGY